MSDLPDEAVNFIGAVTAHFGTPEAVIFHNKRKSGFMPKKFDDTNRGVLFRDDKKAKPEDRDYSGSINVGGTEYWVSGWVKTSKKGSKFLSLSIRPKAAAVGLEMISAADVKMRAKPVEAKCDFDDAVDF